METLIKAAGYVRVSTAIQIEGESLTTQRQQIEDYAKQRGWELTKIYADEGATGTKTEYRTQFQEMLNDAKARHFSVIIFTKLSRFARNARDFLNHSYELKQSSVELISLKENIDPTTAAGKMIIGVLALFAEWEHETIRDQMYENKMARWRENRTFIGKPPYGYRWNKESHKLEIVTDEAKIYRDIVNMYVNQGMAFRDIAVKLNSEGFKVKKAGWSSAVISYMLKNPSYYGHCVVNKHIYVDSKRGAGTRRSKELKPASEKITFPIEALISKTEWDKIQTTTQFRKITTKHTGEHTMQFFLRNVLVCGRCGGRMNARIGSKRKDGTYNRYYVCYWAGTSKKSIEKHHKKCDLPFIKAEEIENSIWADIVVMFSLNPKRAIGDLFNTDNINNEIQNQENILSKVTEDINRLKRIRERLFIVLGEDNANVNELHQRLEGNQIRKLELDSQKAEAENKLRDLKHILNEKQEITNFINENKKQLTLLRKEIFKLGATERKLLVEAMLTGPVVIDYQEDNPIDGAGGAMANYRLRYNPEIIQRFIDEGKIQLLDKNSRNYYATTDS